ncbi:TetR/AcrR family transcriptional regulator [Pedobacter cryoconitis]|uniref:TetR family transcriptional regulator n=1 Tax=Pedobacter cryoconitis TaxID=188932 RepID=A0A327SEH2_9SPHI|nr:TetR/AcrR family transcriptional regulator [Pedobacter cryoconitis]RAJ27035.1 TetR family transcriptional regulator [Pedobacter cryoconitis]
MLDKNVLNKTEPKNRKLTERKLIDAVGEIIRSKGYTGLGVNAIAKSAGVSKKLIYRYFGTVDSLIETYLIERDYWVTFSKKVSDAAVASNKKQTMIEFSSSIFENQFDFFFNEDEMQRIILWEISEKSNILNELSRKREAMGEELLKLTDPYFKDSDINFRAVSAIIICGIYYSVLHTKKNASTLCGLDLNTEAGRKEITRTVRKIVELCFGSKKKKTAV